MLLGLLALQASAIAVGGALEATACKPCHEQTVATFLQTAHVVSSAEATARSIKGRFAAGHNVLRTRSPGVSFRMEERNGAFYETGVDSARGRAITRRIELVVGSGRRGQSYLYWSGGLLFELPVSYLTGLGAWINSPGYADGEIDFGRLIVPRCLECHSTSFPLQTERGVVRYSRRYQLGISCEKCHDVHRPERDVALLAEKCLACHQAGQHPRAAEIAGLMMTSCIDCHMPDRKSNAIQINTPANRTALYYRSHEIGIYPEVAARVLQVNRER